MLNYNKIVILLFVISYIDTFIISSKIRKLNKIDTNIELLWTADNANNHDFSKLYNNSNKNIRVNDAVFKNYVLNLRDINDSCRRNIGLYLTYKKFNIKLDFNMNKILEDIYNSIKNNYNNESKIISILLFLYNILDIIKYKDIKINPYDAFKSLKNFGKLKNLIYNGFSSLNKSFSKNNKIFISKDYLIEFNNKRYSLIVIYNYIFINAELVESINEHNEENEVSMINYENQIRKLLSEQNEDILSELNLSSDKEDKQEKKVENTMRLTLSKFNNNDAEYIVKETNKRKGSGSYGIIKTYVIESYPLVQYRNIDVIGKRMKDPSEVKEIKNEMDINIFLTKECPNSVMKYLGIGKLAYKNDKIYLFELGKMTLEEYLKLNHNKLTIHKKKKTNSNKLNWSIGMHQC